MTSNVQDAQQFTINFTNNNLNGSANFNPAYRTSKTRVCVTVGMMTTGYDCPDILNLALMRPIYSPTDFIQIKGRGTRKHNFQEQLIGRELKEQVGVRPKEKYKIFDFFANCEYFETEFDYDQVLILPHLGSGEGGIDTPPPVIFEYDNTSPDQVKSINVIEVGPNGMKIDRMFFEKFGERVKRDPVVVEKIAAGEWDEVDRYIEEKVLNKPVEFFTKEKIRQALHSDRRLTMREIVEYIFGLVPYIKSKNELLDDEFDKFNSRFMPGKKVFAAAKNVFKAYILDLNFRQIVESGNFAMLNVNPNGKSFKQIPPELRRAIPEYNELRIDAAGRATVKRTDASAAASVQLN